MTNFRPLNDYVVAKRIEGEPKSKGGIYLTLSAREQQNSAVVVAVGPGKVSKKTGEREPLQISANDTVLFAEDEKTAREKGYLIKFLEDGQEVEYWFLRERQIIGVVSPSQ